MQNVNVTIADSTRIRCGVMSLSSTFMVSFVLLVLVFSTTATAQEAYIDREAKIKSAYLYKFIRYVQWPDATMAADSQFVIGSVGGSSVDTYLAAIAKTRTAKGKKLVFRRVESVQQAKSCHVLFLPNHTDSQLRNTILKELHASPVLVVGESDPVYLRLGGVITFNVVNNKVRLRLSTTNASAKGLKVSSKLARLAEVID